MYRTISIRPFAFGVVLSAAFCLPVNAQPVIVARPGTASWEVERLQSKAEALFEKPASYAMAAGMLKRAADLQSLDDARRVSDRALAATLWYYAGQKSAARKALKQAGEEALAQGQVVKAARLFTDACYIAVEQEKKTDARELHAAAVRLARSQAVTVADRETLLRRLEGATTIVATW